MARTNIHHEHKKQELLTSIWELLLQYGYEEMSISLIIKELAISRGAFYHYFKSKEECVDEAIASYIHSTVTQLQAMDIKKDSATHRLQAAIQNAVQLFHNYPIQTQLHTKKQNTVFHQKLMIAFTKHMAFFYADIIQDGVATKEFTTSYPLELAEMILTLSNFYIDIVLFQWDPQSLDRKVEALEELINASLHTKKYTSFFPFYDEGNK